MDAVPTSRSRTDADHSRKNTTFRYHLKRDGERKLVCKSMFLLTTGLGRWSVQQRARGLAAPTTAAARSGYYDGTKGAREFMRTDFFNNRVRLQSGFPTFISCQRQDANVLPKRRQSHQGDKLCDVSTVPLVARWPVFLARGSDADGEPHCHNAFPLLSCFHKQDLLGTNNTNNDRSVQALQREMYRAQQSPTVTTRLHKFSLTSLRK